MGRTPIYRAAVLGTRRLGRLLWNSCLPPALPVTAYRIRSGKCLVRGARGWHHCDSQCRLGRPGTAAAERDLGSCQYRWGIARVAPLGGRGRSGPPSEYDAYTFSGRRYLPEERSLGRRGFISPTSCARSWGPASCVQNENVRSGDVLRSRVPRLRLMRPPTLVDENFGP